MHHTKTIGCLLLVLSLSCKSENATAGGLPGIEVADHLALGQKVRGVPVGSTPKEVSSLLGAPSYKTEGDGDNHYQFWRFRVMKAPVPTPGAPGGIRYEVWKAQFIGGKLVFGALVPHGGG